MTVHEALMWAHAELLAANVGSSWLSEEERQHALRLEAESLLLWATGWSRSRLISSFADHLEANAEARLREAVRQRIRGVPLQYATGQAAFYGRLFSVRPGCLIPRPETEVLADLAIDWIQQHRPASTVVDFGTGSGILAVTVRLECPQSTVYALDLSREALEIARENAVLLEASPGVEFVHTDGLRWLRESSVPLHVLVSNPPYIPSRDVEQLDDEVRLYEPHLALDGGEDGLDVYRALSELGDAHFAPGPAALFLEVGESQAEQVHALFAVPERQAEPEAEPDVEATSESGAQSRWPNWQFAVEPDLRGVPRVVWGFRKQRCESGISKVMRR